MSRRRGALPDALNIGERDILTRWDDGATLASIIDDTGYKAGFVEMVIHVYDDCGEAERRWRNAARRSGEAFLAAIAACGGSFA